MERETIDVQLTADERALILRYGYPFDQIRNALLACNDALIHVIALDAFELEKLIGDLCTSINDTRPGALRDRLCDVCDRIEYTERTGDGMLCDY